MLFHDLPCGCGTCGCVCVEHSTSRRDEPCTAHLLEAIVRASVTETARLVAIGLFVSTIAVWVALFAAR